MPSEFAKTKDNSLVHNLHYKLKPILIIMIKAVSPLFYLDQQVSGATAISVIDSIRQGVAIKLI